MADIIDPVAHAQGLKAATKKVKYEKICFAKLSVSVDQLCMGQPEELTTFFCYLRGLRFDDKPDYTYLRRLLRDLFCRKQYIWDYVFDWSDIPALAKQKFATARALDTPPPRALKAAETRPVKKAEAVKTTEVDHTVKGQSEGAAALVLQTERNR